MAGLGPEQLVAAALIAMFAGFVKGAVGFGMPMLMISGLTIFLPVETALAILILPTLLTNGTQALRQGVAVALATIKRFQIFLIVGFAFLVLGAQLVPVLSARVLMLMIGIPVSIFAAIMLLGVRFHVTEAARSRVEAMVAVVAGLVGGMSGVWGPPTVAYLTAINEPKQAHVRTQGVIYGLGALVLLLAHLRTGIVTPGTSLLSAIMIVPAMAGMWLGFRLNDRLDQEKFRRATLVVLILAGLNLIRRGLMG